MIDRNGGDLIRSRAANKDGAIVCQRTIKTTGVESQYGNGVRPEKWKYPQGHFRLLELDAVSVIRLLASDPYWSLALELPTLRFPSLILAQGL